MGAVSCLNLSCHDFSIDLAKSNSNGITRIQKIIESPNFQLEETTRMVCTPNGIQPNSLSFNAQQEIYSFQFYARENDLLSVTLNGDQSTDTVVLLFQYSDQRTAEISQTPLVLITSNDDGGLGGLSALSYLFTKSDPYVLIISSWSGFNTGEIDFSMNVERASINEDDISSVSSSSATIDVCVKMINRCRSIDGTWNSREQQCIFTIEDASNTVDSSMNYQEIIRTRCDQFCRREGRLWFDNCIMDNRPMDVCLQLARKRDMQCMNRCVEEVCTVSVCTSAE